MVPSRERGKEKAMAIHDYSRSLPYELELFVIETLRRWKDPELSWAGEVTLVFPGSGGQISGLREERRTLFDVSSGYGWERVDFGFKKITYQHGKGHMLIESRVVKPKHEKEEDEISAGDVRE